MTTRVLLNATDGALSLRAVRRYVLELAAGLGGKSSDVETHLVFFTHRVGRVRDFLSLLPPDCSYQTHVLPLPRRILNERHRVSRFELRRLEKLVDVYHETSFDQPRFRDIPTVTTLHGLAPIVRPDLCDPEFVRDKMAWFERMNRTSDFFAPVSESTRREFLDRVPDVPADHARAIPLGISANFAPRDRETARSEARERLGVERPYVLYVGGIQKNKNIPRVVRTFGQLSERGLFDGDLVLVGDLHYSKSEFEQLVAAEGIQGRVRWLGCYAPEDERLANAYRAAQMFLFPTYYEGWTSPPLEAMACGTPVICSSASSLPETVGDAAILVDPDDEEAWVQQAAQILSSPHYRSTLIERGFDRAAQFPWSRTVDRTSTFYEDILNTGGVVDSRESNSQDVDTVGVDA